MSRLVAAVVVAAFVPTIALTAPANAVGYEHPQVVSADPVNSTPHVKDGSVLAIATVGDRVYVGGTFTTVVNAGASTGATRNYLFAYDRSTGQVLSGFAPVLDRPVETIAAAPDGSSIIIGGRFTTVNGQAQRSLAMLRPDGTRVATFKSKTNGIVTKVLVRGNRLLVAGKFSTVAAGTPRANLAAFDATIGSLDTAFNVPVTEGRTKSTGTVTKPVVVEMDANSAGSRLVVIGNFRRVDGMLRQQIATIDLETNRVTPWNTNRFPNGPSGAPDAFPCAQVFDTQMRDVEFSQAGNYFVVVTTGGAPDRNVKSLCDTATRWETAPTLKPGGETETWRNCTGGDTLYSVAISSSATGTGGAVYVGGHQRWLDNCGGRDSAVPGSFSAEGIGAIDARTGLAIRSWNPGRTRGVGAEELVADRDGLYVGSDTERLAGEYHARLGLFPLN